MIKKLTLSVSLLVLSQTIFADECNFTIEQDRLLHLAASYGEPFNYRKTLPAIVMQESFVGDHVIRMNAKDGDYGSYGITHVMLTTAMWLEGETNSWKARDVIFERLVKDDIYALHLAVKKLNSVHNESKGWINTWKSYNGSMKYAYKIRDNIRLLERCGYFNWK